MSIKPEYFDYLRHFGKTTTVLDLSKNPGNPNMVALRHDVDYNLDLALEMSYWEMDNGFRSTYYILHSADYWKDPRLLEKCLQIQDFGHEVGLHLNVLTEWASGITPDVAKRLEEILHPLRKAGLNIAGISSHGDKMCYEKQFVNYWCFEELRPEHPHVTESGLSAEGIAAEDSRHQILYPSSHSLVRQDGGIFDLWSVSMKSLGIEYDATHVPHELYYTDSGGSWTRSPDPITKDLGKGRVQVLIHPEYWSGQQKIYFFLSTARSGSKWLANFLDKATPLMGKHEFMLNHRLAEGELVEDKRTAEGFTGLVKNTGEVKSLLLEARRWIEELPCDYAEANVYLERFLPLLKDIFPEAVLVHLYRDPKDVVRSIINRDWYDTPEDSKHPVMDVSGWDSLGQFDKSCWYVRKTNESLMEDCDYSIAFKQMVGDIEYIINSLKNMDIPVYPRLALQQHDKRINENYNYKFPDYRDWPDQRKRVFHSILDPVNARLCYETMGHDNTGSSYDAKYFRLVYRIIDGLKSLRKATGGRVKKAPLVLYEYQYRGKIPKKNWSIGCTVNVTLDGIEITPQGGRNAYFILKGGYWSKLKRGSGWQSPIGYYYRGKLDAEIEGEENAQLFCLMYDRQGKLLAKRSLGRIRNVSRLDFSFRVRCDAFKFNIAVYMPVAKLPERILVKHILVESVPLKQ